MNFSFQERVNEWVNDGTLRPGQILREGSCSGMYLFSLQFEPDGLLLKKECLFDRNGSALLHFEKFLRREEKREQREEEDDDDMSIIRTKSPFFQPGPPRTLDQEINSPKTPDPPTERSDPIHCSFFFICSRAFLFHPICC